MRIVTIALALIMALSIGTFALADTLITEEAAKSIALADAKITEDIKFVKIELDREDGKQVYEVEFVHSGAEYDYEIDAVSGEILSLDTDAEIFDAKAGIITSEAATYIALKRAGLTMDQVRAFKCEYDRKIFSERYEIEFKAGFREYECEIDAKTGEIVSWDEEFGL